MPKFVECSITLTDEIVAVMRKLDVGDYHFIVRAAGLSDEEMVVRVLAKDLPDE